MGDAVVSSYGGWVSVSAGQLERPRGPPLGPDRLRQLERLEPHPAATDARGGAAVSRFAALSLAPLVAFAGAGRVAPPDVRPRRLFRPHWLRGIARADVVDAARAHRGPHAGDPVREPGRASRTQDRPRRGRRFRQAGPQGRGGHCFEQNGLFLQVLGAMGFRVQPRARASGSIAPVPTRPRARTCSCSWRSTAPAG